MYLCHWMVLSVLPLLVEVVRGRRRSRRTAQQPQTATTRGRSDS
jgi:hypothetical protein